MKTARFWLLPICITLLSGCSNETSSKEPHLQIASAALGGSERTALTGLAESLPAKSQLPQGKNVYIFNETLINTGKESEGLRIQLSGSALTKKLLSNITAVVESYADTDQKRLIGRAIVPLHEDGENLTGLSSSIPLKTQQQPCLLNQNPGFNEIDVELFADTENKGSGGLQISIEPYEHSTRPAVVRKQTFEVTDERQNFAGLFEAPAQFPVAVYPGAHFTHGSKESDVKYTVAFETEDPAEKVADFYRSELSKRGWKTRAFAFTNQKGQLSLDKRSDDATAKKNDDMLIADKDNQRLLLNITKHSWGGVEAQFDLAPLPAGGAPPAQEAQSSSAEEEALKAAESASSGAEQTDTAPAGSNTGSGE